MDMTFINKLCGGNWPKIVTLCKKSSNISFSGIFGTQISILQSNNILTKNSEKGRSVLAKNSVFFCKSQVIISVSGFFGTQISI